MRLNEILRVRLSSDQTSVLIKRERYIEKVYTEKQPHTDTSRRAMSPDSSPVGALVLNF